MKTLVSTLAVLGLSAFAAGNAAACQSASCEAARYLQEEGRDDIVTALGGWGKPNFAIEVIGAWKPLEIHDYTGETEDMYVNGRQGDDIIITGSGNDYILGGPGDDHIFAEGGNDIIMGGRGDDVIFPGPGNDFVYGGRGQDEYTIDTGDRDEDVFLFGTRKDEKDLFHIADPAGAVNGNGVLLLGTFEDLKKGYASGGWADSAWEMKWMARQVDIEAVPMPQVNLGGVWGTATLFTDAFKDKAWRFTHFDLTGRGSTPDLFLHGVDVIFLNEQFKAYK